ncbi:MAG: hypothetical protein KGO82_12220 [Bacteroidota bacterium]|nr:hypothetical protein [Bacteroidota bacterium]
MNDIITGCILATVLIGCFAYFRFGPDKKETTETSWKGMTPAQGYSKMIGVIADAKEPRDLYQLTGMAIDFRVHFAGKISEKEIDAYLYDINAEKEKKANALLLERVRNWRSRQQNLSTV